MKRSTHISALLLVTVFGIATRGPRGAFAQAGGGTMTAGSGRRVSALHGRLRDGNTNLPIADGYVFVLDSSRKRVLGYSRTMGGRGPDSGFWQVTGLPAAGKVWLIGFHPKLKSSLAVKQVRLDGTYKKVPEFDTLAAARAAVPDGEAGLLSLLGTIAHEANRVTGDRQAVAFADQLLQQVRSGSTEPNKPGDTGRQTTALKVGAIPAYPRSRKDPQKTATYRSSDPPSRIASWYEKTAGEMGWQAVTRSRGGKYHVFVSTSRAAAEKAQDRQRADVPVIIIGIWERRGRSRESTRYQIVAY